MPSMKMVLTVAVIAFVVYLAAPKVQAALKL